ncbi:hypothetical protein A5780_14505 [Nocardia sp. 852002-20019_SCH5090214]|nr:hypothetical protein A5780_14505 [Nocardia sp. 852002-20019_SCH5090214]
MVAQLVSTGLWPLVLLVAAVVGVTTTALLRAEKRDIPTIFSVFAHAFGFHKTTGSTAGQYDSQQTDRTAEAERPEEAM